MIDVSDGLLQDLGHICKVSKIGAVFWEEKLPLSPAYRALCGKEGTRPALTGDEDYELLFCAPPRNRSRIAKLQHGTADLVMTRIGTCVSARAGITVLDSAGKPLSIRAEGHDHFKKY